MTICELAVIPVRKEPSDKSEMTSQVLFGEQMEILEEREKWLMIRLQHDGYEGWIDRKQALNLENFPVTEARPSNMLFSILQVGDQHIIIPAGSYLYNKSGQSFHIGEAEYKPINTAEPKQNDLAVTAHMFLGSPYLWGGRTFMGIDCSGFSQVVMRIHGWNIPRDAYQQAEQGDTVSFIEETRTGDLAFFDNSEGRITHVGIILSDSTDGKRIIHASGKVRIDTLDHQGIYNNDTGLYSHNLRIIKRYS